MASHFNITMSPAQAHQARGLHQIRFKPKQSRTSPTPQHHQDITVPANKPIKYPNHHHLFTHPFNFQKFQFLNPFN
jgi:hypothetical protein